MSHRSLVFILSHFGYTTVFLERFMFHRNMFACVRVLFDQLALQNCICPLGIFTETIFVQPACCNSEAAPDPRCQCEEIVCSFFLWPLLVEFSGQWWQDPMHRKQTKTVHLRIIQFHRPKKPSNKRSLPALQYLTPDGPYLKTVQLQGCESKHLLPHHLGLPSSFANLRLFLPANWEPEVQAILEGTNKDRKEHMYQLYLMDKTHVQNLSVEKK